MEKELTTKFFLKNKFWVSFGLNKLSKRTKINNKFLNLEAISQDMAMEAVPTSPPYNKLQCLQFMF
jgi:hypothetical protein